MPDAHVPIDNAEEEEDLQNPKKLTTEENDHFIKLKNHLTNGEKREFLTEYTSSKLLATYNNFQIELLIKALYTTTNDADIFETILPRITDITYTPKKYRNNTDRRTGNLTLIDAVCCMENFDIYRKIIAHENLDLSKKIFIVATLILRLKESLFGMWFDALYHAKPFNLNEINEDDNLSDTLLKKALRKGNNTAIKRLLRGGAYIGEQIYFNTNHELEPQDIEECFDSCITVNEVYSESKKIIIFDYTNLVPPIKCTNCNEMKAIIAILHSKNHLHLLQHPLITSFMAIKFQRLVRFLYVNLFLYLFYLTSIVAYVIAVCQKYESTNLFVYLTRWSSFLGIMYLIFREITQLSSLDDYFTKPSNYLELILITFSISTITMETFDDKEIVVVCTILLIGAEFCLLVGNLPILSISTHMLMLKEVLRTFIQSFSLYSIFFFTFATCFYVFFRNENQTFASILTSFVKTVAMFTGELDLDSLEFKTNIYSYILFLLIVICMAVVLMNLLNGLAVSDIQAIRNQAVLSGLIFRANFLKNHDIKIFLQYRDKDRKHLPKAFCSCKMVVHVELNNTNFTNNLIFLRECKICMKLNNHKNTNHWKWYRFFEEENILQIVDSCMGKSKSMELSIVEEAIHIIRNKFKSTSNEKLQLKNIEDKMNMIENNERIQSQKIEDKMNIIENKIEQILKILK